LIERSGVKDSPIPLDTLSKYIGVFGNLHRNQNPRWGAAPHKPILQLAVLDEIEQGRIPSNLVELTPELAAGFRAYWRILVPEDTWLDKIANPFRFMVQEGFWELTKNGLPVSTQSLGMNPSIRQLTTQVDGAILAQDLWEQLQDRAAVNTLRTFLLKHYFGVGVAEVQSTLPENPIDYEAERLKAEAQSKFRIKKVREDRDETGYYVRHALFPKVVKSLYNDTCAVCGLNVRTGEGSGLVDAAHIMPFGIFHYDDPRNGIALCKNHHWGFDAGWFSATDEYKIVVSPHLQNALIYLTAGASLLIPTQSHYAPAPDALAWHRSHVYRK
jgi:putative restriction endonuclease